MLLRSEGHPVKLCPQILRHTLLSRPCCSAVRRSALSPNTPSRTPTPASCQTASLKFDRTLLLVPLQAQGKKSAKARRSCLPGQPLARSESLQPYYTTVKQLPDNAAQGRSSLCFWYRCRLKGKTAEGAWLLPAGSAAPDFAPPVRRPTAKHMHEHSTTAASSPAVVAMKRVSGVQLPGLHGTEARLRG